ncbi:alpha-glucosidase [Rhodospirillum centenum]|uniref:Alpha-glucosidase, putative n=1 Tax=Rhodospirillum centenum (strain ATCC 51521 / SW) TaxID=414684 RepID=B6INK3_RHOCS|nr:alpha-glucosidase [Rhodospirillum centenum]ACI99100.1 alpha-glucosidase, putative [Rhodospirillum centenum SW]
MDGSGKAATGRTETGRPGSAQAEWWRGAVLYQIYPRSFLDTNGDGIGDLEGITRRLDHVASLGVDGIWICPFFTSPMDDFGYDVADYRAVDPMFGTLEDFDRLLAAAHDRGLKVVIDMVLSHSSDRHAWFAESRRDRTSPKADWYVWADPKPDGTPPNNWLSVFGGSAWTWDPRRAQYYLHNFLTSQPDLNLHNPEVVEAVMGECRFWLERGVDGFRLDVANFYTHDRLLRDNPPRTARATDGVPERNPYGMQAHLYDKTQPETLEVLRRLRRLMDEFPGTFTVAEVSDDDSVGTCARYVAGADRLHTAYGFSLLSCPFDAGSLRGHLEAFERQPGGGWPAWAFGNHDVMRPVTRWGGPERDAAFARQLVALLGCLRGTVFLFQGEELGLPEADVPYDRLQDPYGRTFWPEFKGRDGCRTPMPWTTQAPSAGFTAPDVEPWLPVPPAHLPLSVAAQEGDPDSVLAFTRAFLRWRKGQRALTGGTIRFLDTPEPILAFVREMAGAPPLLCLFNLGRDPAVWEPAGDAALVIVAQAGAPGAVAGDARHLALPGHGFSIAVLEG